MSILYLTEPGTCVNKSGGKFIITYKDDTKKELPSGYIDAVVVMTNVQLTHGVITSLLRDGKQLLYVDRIGKVLGSLGPDCSAARLMLRQLEIYNSLDKRLQLAKQLVTDKLLSQRELLQLHNKRRNSLVVKQATTNISLLATRVGHCISINSLMGIEGAAAQAYFGCFGELLTNNSFAWTGRRKYPAPDEINCMLGFAYFLLEKDIRVMLATSGLAKEFGFLHELDLRKDSLVYDLMEPFRAEIADRIVLKSINLRRFNPEDFEYVEGACILTPEARKRFIAYYEENVGSYDGEVVPRSKIASYIRSFAEKIRELQEAVA